MRIIGKSLVLIALVAVLVIVLNMSSDESDGTTVEIVIREGAVVGYEDDEHNGVPNITEGPIYLDSSYHIWAVALSPEYGSVYINGTLFDYHVDHRVGDYPDGICFEVFRDDYSIHFMSNGGSGNPIESIDVVLDGSCTIPDITYSLWGRNASVWNTMENGTGEDIYPGAIVDLDFIRSNYNVTENRLDLFPKWIETEYSFSFDRNDGSGSIPGILSNVTISSLTSIPEIGLTKIGYNAVTWNTSPNGNGFDVESGLLEMDDYFINHCFGIGNNVVLYPKWTEASYSIIFNTGETYGTTPNPLNNITIGSLITLPEPTFSRTGYEMVGWNTREDSTGISLTIGDKVVEADFLESIFTSGSEVTLFPTWVMKGYTVFLTTTQGDITEVQWTKNDSTYTLGYTIESEAIALPSAVSDDRFHYFVCWEDQNGNTVSSIPTGSYGNISLNAVWALKEYTMSINVNGRTVSQKCTLDSSLEDPDCEAGFSFRGWFYKDQDGQEKEFTSMSQMYEGMSIYAVFEPIKDDPIEMAFAASLLVAFFSIAMIYSFRKR